MNGYLQFQNPKKLRALAFSEERIKVGSVDLLQLENYAKGKCQFDNDSPVLRNLLVWFLVAAGVPTATIAEMFEISASRCSTLARQSGEKYTAQYRSSKDIQNILKSSPDKDRACIALAYAQREMMAAEYHLRSGDYSKHVRKCIAMGRAQFLQAFEALQGQQCMCQWCANAAHKQHEVFVYWLEPTPEDFPASITRLLAKVAKYGGQFPDDELSREEASQALAWIREQQLQQWRAQNAGRAEPSS